MTANRAKRKSRNLEDLVDTDVYLDAIAARAKAARQIAKLPTASPKYRTERFRIIRRHIATEYRAAIQAIREATYRSDLEQCRDTLIERLEHGNTLPALPKRDRLWSRLMAELELVEDALSEDCMWRYTDRLDDLEAIVNGETPERENIKWPV